MIGDGFTMHIIALPLFAGLRDIRAGEEKLENAPSVVPHQSPDSTQRLHQLADKTSFS
jgi:hypothetical protein